MTYDPYQIYPALGAFSGMPASANFPYAAQQTAQNAVAGALNPFAAAALGLSNNLQNAGIAQTGQQMAPAFGNQQQQGGLSPQQLQLAAAILAAQGVIPQLHAQALLGNAGLSQPFVAGLQNPQFAYQPQAVYGQQQLGQIGSPFGQQQLNPAYQGNPYQANPYNQHQINPYQANVYQANPFQNNQVYGQFAQLAPQSWVGQPGIFGNPQQAFVQGNPLANNPWGARNFQAPGISPWGY